MIVPAAGNGNFTADGRPVEPEISARMDQDKANYAAPALFPFIFDRPIASAYHYVADGQMVAGAAITPRSPGTRFARLNTRLSTGNFAGEQYAIEESVGLEENQKYSSPEQAEAVAFRHTTNVILIGREARSAALATGPNVPTAAPAILWSDPNADPFSDVAVGRQAVFYGCGREANVMTAGRETFEVLKKWAMARGLIKISDSDARWPQLLAALFDVERFVVARAVSDLANDGQAPNPEQIWGDSVIIAYVDQLGDFHEPSFGRTFCADKKTNLGVTLFGYLQTNIKAGIVRAEQTVAEVLTAPAAGFHFHNVLA
jgi:hypothetical protein